MLSLAIKPSTLKKLDYNSNPISRLTAVRSIYSMISETVPAPTVRPPSRIANLNPFSIAIGLINSISSCELSQGITISVPSGRCTIPVTSVVRK